MCLVSINYGRIFHRFHMQNVAIKNTNITLTIVCWRLAYTSSAFQAWQWKIFATLNLRRKSIIQWRRSVCRRWWQNRHSRNVLPFMKLDGLLLCLRDKLGRFPGPNELSPRAETLPKVNLDDKSKYNLSVHNFTLTILNGSHMFRLHKLAIFRLYISEV